jgi:hypothetical protein
LRVKEAKLEARGVEPLGGLGDQVFGDQPWRTASASVLKPGVQMLQERSVPAWSASAAEWVMSAVFLWPWFTSTMAPQSETTKPLKPQASRRCSLSSILLVQAGNSSMEL